MAVEHYENFPVASILLPRQLRAPVEAIYRFARKADDIADEGDAAASVRAEALHAMRIELDRALAGHAVADPTVAAVARTVRQWRLSPHYFRDLLDAFMQDVQVNRYADFATLMEYCRRSANPVGRLLLELFGERSAESLRQSDSICSALQLANFWQDVALDRNKGRVYIPMEDCRRYAIDIETLPQARHSPQWKALMRFQCERTRALMISGAPLARRLKGRIGFELRLIVEGGLRILERIDECSGDVFQGRPVLRRRDWARMLARALRPAWRAS